MGKHMVQVDWPQTSLSYLSSLLAHCITLSGYPSRGELAMGMVSFGYVPSLEASIDIMMVLAFPVEFAAVIERHSTTCWLTLDDDNEERESVGTSSSRRRSPAADRQTPIKSKTNSTTTGAKSDSQLEQTEPATLVGTSDKTDRIQILTMHHNPNEWFNCLLGHRLNWVQGYNSDVTRLETFFLMDVKLLYRKVSSRWLYERCYIWIAGRGQLRSILHEYKLVPVYEAASDPSWSSARHKGGMWPTECRARSRQGRENGIHRDCSPTQDSQ